MSYMDRMCLKMLGMCVAPFFAAWLLAWLARTAMLSYAQLGGRVLAVDVASYVVALGVLGSALVTLCQGWRLWNWRQGRGAACFVCTCLLGRPHDGRLGRVRTCMGCGKEHPMTALAMRPLQRIPSSD